MPRWLIVTLMFTTIVSSEARSQQSLQELESISQFEQALRAVDAIKHSKRLQCVVSIASEPVCRCLAQQLPVDTYIRGYAAIIEHGPDYGQLSAADKMIVDRCIAGGK